MKLLVPLVALATATNAFFLFGTKNILTTERIDPIVNPGGQSSHSHAVIGGSNFRPNMNTESLRQSPCTTSPINEDKSSYWFPNLYFQWKNGSFTSVTNGVVIYYLFYQNSKATAFPDDFRMISGDPYLRTYDANSNAQKAITFRCLDFQGKSVDYNGLPPVQCPNGVRAQVNFQSCWDGKNVDSPDHKSHVAYRSGGPDSGDCTDPNFPVNLPRIFMEVYLSTQDFHSVFDQAMNTTQPFVVSSGDPTGYGFHADFFNGWGLGVLQKVVDNCYCDGQGEAFGFGDPRCCSSKGLITLQESDKDKIPCRITKQFDEQTTGTLPKLPGNNPIQPFGTRANVLPNDVEAARIEPVYVYTGDTPTATGNVVAPGTKPASSPDKADPAIAQPQNVPAAPLEQAPPKSAPTPATPLPPCMAPAKKDNHRRNARRMNNAGHGDFLLV